MRLEGYRRLDVLGGQARRRIAVNASLLQQAPNVRPQSPTRDEDEPGKTIATGAMGVVEGILKGVERSAPKAVTRAEKVARKIADMHISAPGNVLDAAEFLTSDNKPRSAASIVGGRIGGALGALVPGLEPVTIPAGAVLGGLAGEWAYDHREDIRRAVTQPPLHPGAYKY